MDTKMEEKQKSLLLSFPLVNTTTLAQLGAVMTDEDIHLLQSLGITKKFARKSVLAYTNAKIENLLFLLKEALI